MTNQADSIAARELHLTIYNEGRLYPERLKVQKQVHAFYVAGKYDADKAVKSWLRFVDLGAVDYCKQFPGVKFNAATRREAARALEREYFAEMEIGNP